ncbi:MAG: protein BatD [Aliivibrio sp.]|nr:protein BatD [Aliivibrio sp.]
MNLRRLPSLLSLFITLILGFFSFATMASEQPQLQQLQAQGSVLVSAHLDGVQDVAVDQQVIVTIELLTDTWFTKGTRIHRFEVDNALVLQRNSFANNSIEKIDGKTYSKQSWELVLYPLESGKYTIPSIVVDVSVKGDNGNVSGQIITAPLHFSANQPDLALGVLPAFVGDDPRFEQNWKIVRANKNESNQNSSLDKLTPLQVGDAIERTMVLTVNNASSTLLPQLIMDRLDDNKLITYRESPQFNDKQNRGQYSATRTEKVIYVVKDAGTIVFPEQTYGQWSVAQQKILMHEIGSKTFEAEHTAASYLKAYRVVILSIIAATTVMIFMLVWFFRHYQNVKSRDRLPLWWQFLLATKNKDNVMCEFILYKKKLRKTQSVRIADMPSNTLFFQQWLMVRYSNHNEKCITMTPFKWMTIWLSY